MQAINTNMLVFYIVIGCFAVGASAVFLTNRMSGNRR